MTPAPVARHGRLTRWLHWSMALLFAWVFASALAHALAEKSALDALLWPSHKPVGTLLMLLLVPRVVWALAQARRRPPPVSAAARAGHLALYALMLAVPAIGLLRQWGSGRAFAPLGLPLMPGFDASQKVEWTLRLGGLLHGNLGWALLALVVGHVAAALWHQRPGHTPVLARMAG
ncbi:MAG TPA: cytochrome b/b6 domain-containing protein [Ottowia sp.]|nr:cytochrome b/b6 domain-containing protein [Ottowia sp.]